MCPWRSSPLLSSFFSCSFHSVPLLLILSSSLYPLLCARLLFIDRFGQCVQAFRPKLLPCTPPGLSLLTPLFPLLLPPPASGFVHTSNKKLFFFFSFFYQADYLHPAVWGRALYAITPCSRKRHRWVLEIKMLQALSPLIGFSQFRAHPPKIQPSTLSAKKKPVMLKLTIYSYTLICINNHFTS